MSKLVENVLLGILALCAAIPILFLFVMVVSCTEYQLKQAAWDEHVRQHHLDAVK